MRSSGESYRFVAGGEFDVEPGDKSVNEVIAADRQVKGKFECEIVGRTFVEVECDYCARIGNHGFEFDCVDQGFSESGHLQRCIVKAVDVIPD